MSAPEMIGLYSVWGSLLFGPIIGLLLAFWFRRHFPSLIYRTLITCACVIATIGLAWLLDIGWLWDVMDLLSVAVAYLAYCLIFGLLWVCARSAPRYALAISATAPILLGFFAGTAGSLGLVFILGDIVSPPAKEIVMAPGLFCQVKEWGYAFSDEGYDVILYRYPRFLPVIGWEARKVRVDETDPGDGPKSATCEGVAKSL